MRYQWPAYGAFSRTADGGMEIKTAKKKPRKKAEPEPVVEPEVVTDGDE